MANQADKSEATKTRIIEIARASFARDGFVKTALSEIVASAGVTTGALYHHFGGKKGLFIAVAEHVEQEILDHVVARAIQGASLWDTLENGLEVTLEICAQPDIQQIVFRDAPNVVGATAWRDIEMKYAFGLMQNTIQDLAKADAIDAPLPLLTAQILLGSVIEAAHGVALADDQPAALREAAFTIRKMVRGLQLESGAVET